MKKILIAAALVALGSPAYAQSGANPSAPQPGSTGAGVNVPATTPTGTAIDRPDSTRSKTVAPGRTSKEGMKKKPIKK